MPALLSYKDLIVHILLLSNVKLGKRKIESLFISISILGFSYICKI